MKGYKVFHPDWTGKSGFQFEVGKTYEEDVKLEIGRKGLHFCKNIADCFNYYHFNPENKVAEIEALGYIKRDGHKYCTNKIRIIKELTWQNVLDLANTGESCNGRNNTGDHNIGDDNGGSYNVGCRNTGYYNNGDGNAGYYNDGNWNSGNWNFGDYNSGDWNCTCCSSGCFNTERQTMFFFNKPSTWTYQQWLQSDAREILERCPSNTLTWMWRSDMTKKEKKEHPDYKITKGFLKSVYDTEKQQRWWDLLSDEKKNIVMQLPNFDKDIFEEITGIEIHTAPQGE